MFRVDPAGRADTCAPYQCPVGLTIPQAGEADRLRDRSLALGMCHATTGAEVSRRERCTIDSIEHGGAMVKQSKNDATDSAAGFYFQAMYGLVVLLDAADGHAVSVETADDIEKTGPRPQLLQLKHSLGIPPPLTEKNDGLWNTFSIWIPQLRVPELTFAFVTCADIPDGHKLRGLASPDGDRTEVLSLLETEAQRVVQAVSNAKAKKPAGGAAGAAIPYKDRLEGCTAFLTLPPGERLAFLKRTVILHRSFNLAAIETVVTDKLRTLPQAIRLRAARRLLEWWDSRVARSLAGLDPRRIDRDELLQRYHAIVIELSDDALTDDYSLKLPDDLSGLLGSNMEKQIHLVEGKANRVQRAALARWRARSQRDKWLSETVGVAEDLRRFDRYLIEYWQGRYGPICDDCTTSDDGEKRRRGLELLEWAHHQSPKEVPPPRPRWSGDFLAQGSYQQLADELRVGWHPNYVALMQPSAEVKPLDGNHRVQKSSGASRRGSSSSSTKGRAAK